MLDSQSTAVATFPKSESWSIECFNTNDEKTRRVVRKFISSAIYVEKPINEMPPSRKTSPYFLNSNSDSEFICRTNTSIPEISKIARIKQYSCKSTPKNYPCHNIDNNEIEETKVVRNGDNALGSPKTNSSSDIESQVTVKSRKNGFPKFGSEMKLSLTSLTTDRTGDIDLVEKEKVIKNWLKRKDQEKKRKEMEDLKMRESKETERQIIVEKERENFKKWLAEKKFEEEKKRQIKQREEEKQKLREAEKEKRQVENELCFHVWFRKKKRLELGNVKVFRSKVYRVSHPDRLLKK